MYRNIQAGYNPDSRGLRTCWKSFKGRTVASSGGEGPERDVRHKFVDLFTDLLTTGAGNDSQYMLFSVFVNLKIKQTNFCKMEKL